MTKTASTSATSPATKSAGPILRAENIHKSFRMGEAEVHVLQKVDLTIRTGEFIAIEGRSGSGKSTLMHILGALDAPDEGTGEFQGHEYGRQDAESNVNWAVVTLLAVCGAVGLAVAGWALLHVFWREAPLALYL